MDEKLSEAEKKKIYELEEEMEKRKYEPPVFEKQDGMVFPSQIMEQFNGNRFCVQCSGCHGCR